MSLGNPAFVQKTVSEEHRAKYGWPLGLFSASSPAGIQAELPVRTDMVKA